jgi:hypothetical protein
MEEEQRQFRAYFMGGRPDPGPAAGSVAGPRTPDTVIVPPLSGVDRAGGFGA